ncbi:Hypothetical protein J6898_00384 [Nakaseomyces glabratus]
MTETQTEYFNTRQVSLADDLLKHTTSIGSKLTKVVSPTTKVKEDSLKPMKTISNTISKTTSATTANDSSFDGFNPKYLNSESVYRAQSNSQSGPVVSRTEVNSPYYLPVPVPEAVTDSANPVSSSAKEQYLNGYHHSQYVKEYPTVLLADRFKKWNKILKYLISYLREAAYVEEHIARLHVKLKKKVTFPFLTDLDDHNQLVDPYQKNLPTKRTQPITPAEKKRLEAEAALAAATTTEETTEELDFDTELEDEVPVSSDNDTMAPSGFLKFGSGSIQDIQVLLKKYHGSIAGQQLKVSREIMENVIPKLEGLVKELNNKIREIKSLDGDFRTNLIGQMNQTSRLIQKYNSVVKKLANEKSDATTTIQPKCDPYLVKIQLETQLKKRLAEEKYLMEAFVNLQSSGLDLERIVYTKIQSALENYTALIDSEARLILKNLCQELQQGMLSKPANYEWDQFITHHTNCMLNWTSTQPKPVPRELSDIVYQNMKAPQSKCIRKGYMYYGSGKDVKKYSKGYFILTSHYLHEFKDSDFSKEMKGSTDASNNFCHMAISLVNLIPEKSFSLSDIDIEEITDTEMVFTARSLKSTKPRSSPSPAPIPAPEHKSRSPSITAAVPKFLRGGSSRSTKTRSNSGANRQTLFAEPSLSEPLREIGERTTWHLRLSLGDYDEEYKKQFKKWSSDFKALADFNHSYHRNSFINERAESATRRASKTAGPGEFNKQNSDSSRGSSDSTIVQDSGRSDSKIGNIVGLDEDGNLIASDGRKYSVSPQLQRQGSSGLTSPTSQPGSPLGDGSTTQYRDRVLSLPTNKRQDSTTIEGVMADSKKSLNTSSRGSVSYVTSSKVTRTSSLPVNDKDAASPADVPRSSQMRDQLKSTIDTIDESNQENSASSTMKLSKSMYS